MSLKQVFLSYPLEDAKVFIDPEIARINKGIIESYNTKMIEVNTPEEANCIPLWVSYTSTMNKQALNYLQKYPEKCMSVNNFLRQLISSCPEISEDILSRVAELLESPNGGNIVCGLNLLVTYQLNDVTRCLINNILDSIRTDEMGTICVTPYHEGKEIPPAVQLPIDDLYFLNFLSLLTHNDIWNALQN